MDDTTKYCIAAVLLLAVLIGFPVGCTVRVNSQVVEAINAGASPLEAACAIKGDNTTEGSVCMAAAMERKHD